ncbi:unnamed protein product [Ilex paraguariensis]|uniref:Elongator complex protein 5 n=1 Tax=Ilex paraguariensis TaxID=185542 RepID=A0ABC8S0J1_9AQUA
MGRPQQSSSKKGCGFKLRTFLAGRTSILNCQVTMAESICRALRDGALEGEHAPALTIKDSIDSPFGSVVFNHVLTQLSSNVLAGKSQSKGIVLVALTRSSSFYADLMKSRGNDVASSQNWISVLDCYTDPLGWNDQLMDSGSITNPSAEASVSTSVCKDVRNMDKLVSSILELGKGLVGQGKDRFSVAIDSVIMLSSTGILIGAIVVTVYMCANGQML